MNKKKISKMSDCRTREINIDRVRYSNQSDTILCCRISRLGWLSNYAKISLTNIA